ncbi:MAG: hypothetical protein WAM92_21065 [Mycobacterium sp.]
MAEVSSRLRRGPSIRLSLATGFIGTVVIVLLGIAGPYLKQATTPHPPADPPADPPSIAARSVPAQVVSLPAPVAPATSLPAADNRGFVNSFARCDDQQMLVALGRTALSEVAICAGADGQYVYRGVRLSHGTTLSVGGVTATADGFQARNDGVVYTVAANELVVVSGDAVLAREPMVEYRTLR